MTCQQATELLSPYIDNELDNAQTRLLQEHLSHCPGCRALLEEYKNIDSCIALLETEVPVGFTEHVIQNLPHQVTKKKPGFASMLGVAAAAAVLIIAVTSIAPDLSTADIIVTSDTAQPEAVSASEESLTVASSETTERTDSEVFVHDVKAVGNIDEQNESDDNADDDIDMGGYSGAPVSSAKLYSTATTAEPTEEKSRNSSDSDILESAVIITITNTSSGVLPEILTELDFKDLGDGTRYCEISSTEAEALYQELITLLPEGMVLSFSDPGNTQLGRVVLEP